MIKCDYCSEPILSGEPLAPILNATLNATIHHECGFRMVVGSVGHQKQECSCYGEVDTSEHGLTKRQAAKASLEHYLSCQPTEI